MRISTVEIHYLLMLMGIGNQIDQNSPQTSLDNLVNYIKSESMTEEKVNTLELSNLGKSFMYDVLNDKELTPVVPLKTDCFGGYGKKGADCSYCSLKFDCDKYMQLIKQPTKENSMHVVGEEKKGQTVPEDTKVVEVPAVPEAPTPEEVVPVEPLDEVKVEKPGKTKKAAKSAAAPKAEQTAKSEPAPVKAGAKKKLDQLKKTKVQKEEEKKQEMSKKNVKAVKQPKVKKEAKPKVEKVSMKALLDPVKLEDIKTAFAANLNGCNLFIRRKPAKEDPKSIMVLIPKAKKEWTGEVKALSSKAKGLTNHTMFTVDASKFIKWFQGSVEKK
jgi:hypothetical protein